jgi:DNA-binding response OmpR family regulator
MLRRDASIVRNGRKAVHATILIVDDDATVRAVLGRALRAAGYHVVQASSAESALASLDRGPVDVVLADLVMPQTDGIRLIERARAAHPGVLCALMTGEPDAAARADLVESPICVLPKASSIVEFLEMVRTLVARAGGEVSFPVTCLAPASPTASDLP